MSDIYAADIIFFVRLGWLGLGSGWAGLGRAGRVASSDHCRCLLGVEIAWLLSFETCLGLAGLAGLGLGRLGRCGPAPPAGSASRPAGGPAGEWGRAAFFPLSRRARIAEGELRCPASRLGRGAGPGHLLTPELLAQIMGKIPPRPSATGGTLCLGRGAEGPHAGELTTMTPGPSPIFPSNCVMLAVRLLLRNPALQSKGGLAFTVRAPRSRAIEASQRCGRIVAGAFALCNTIHYVLYTIHYTLYKIYSIQYTIHYILYIYILQGSMAAPKRSDLASEMVSRPANVESAVADVGAHSFLEGIGVVFRDAEALHAAVVLFCVSRLQDIGSGA